MRRQDSDENGARLFVVVSDEQQPQVRAMPQRAVGKLAMRGGFTRQAHAGMDVWARREALSIEESTTGFIENLFRFRPDGGVSVYEAEGWARGTQPWAAWQEGREIPEWLVEIETFSGDDIRGSNSGNLYLGGLLLRTTPADIRHHDGITTFVHKADWGPDTVYVPFSSEESPAPTVA